MKKQKISGLSLRKRTVSSLEAGSLSGGTDTNYGCFTYAPPCMSFTEPPEDPTFICVPPPTGTNPPPNQTNQTCAASCAANCSITCDTGGSNTCPITL